MSNINPRVDIAFKKIFGVEENKDLLISLINSIVGEKDQVSDIILLNPYNPQNFRDDKLSIMDIKAKGLDGKMFNIEIQITTDKDYHKRGLFYWGELYTSQLKKGDGYSSLAKTIGIHILNFTCIYELKNYHNVFHIAEDTTNIRFFDDFEIHTIELPKFQANGNIDLGELVNKIQSSLDIWTAFLTRHDLLNRDALPKELDSQELKKALTVLEVMEFNDDEKDAYNGHLKWLRIEADALLKCREEALEEGKAEGKVEIARKLLKKGQSIEDICDLTELEIAIVEKLALDSHKK